MNNLKIGDPVIVKKIIKNSQMQNLISSGFEKTFSGFVSDVSGSIISIDFCNNLLFPFDLFSKQSPCKEFEFAQDFSDYSFIKKIQFIDAVFDYKVFEQPHIYFC